MARAGAEYIVISAALVTDWSGVMKRVDGIANGSMQIRVRG